MSSKLQLSVVALLVAGVQSGFGAAGDGIQLSESGNVSPFVEVSYTEDSNALFINNERTEDGYLRLKGGLTGEYETSAFMLKGYGWYGYRFYNKYSQLDNDEFGLGMSFKMLREARFNLNIDPKLAYLQDYNQGAIYDAVTFDDPGSLLPQALNSADSSERWVYGIGASVDGRITDKTDAILGYKYSKTEYESDYYDNKSDHLTYLQFDRYVTDKLAGVLFGSYKIEEADDLPEDSEQTDLRVGVNYAATEKIAMVVQGGFMHFEPGYVVADTVDKPSYLVKLLWDATDTVTMYVTANNGFNTDSGSCSVRYSESFGGGVNWAPNEKWDTGLGVTYRTDDYDTVPNPDKDACMSEEDILSLTARIGYVVNNWSSVYVRGAYDDYDNSVDPYDQWRVEGGVKFHY